MTTAQDWENCVNQDATTCGGSGLCAYDLGLDLVPRDAEYCAPFFLTKNVTEILACVGAKEESTCNSFYGSSNRCMWRRGKVVASNNDFIEDSRLFESNFCHPPTTVRWEEEAPQCLDLEDETECRFAQCVWSTGRELIRGNNSFCQLDLISQNATDYAVCSQFNETTCAGQCRWYDAQNDTAANITDGNMTNHTTPHNASQLFTREFCHPVSISNDTTAATW
jgi:hypothetical protein